MLTVLQKFIAEAGYCSRRQAEELIRQGKVVVNGEAAELGMKVDGEDEVKIGGRKLLLSKEKIYIILNKPQGYTCTNRQFAGEKSILDLIGSPERLFAVGRLDKDSRGLVLLTNDGDLTLQLTHPRYEHEKEYVANVKVPISNVKIILEKFKKGIDIGEGDGVVKAKSVEYIGNDKFRIILTEGKKRQIRRMFKTVGCEIADLVRVRIGKIELGDLQEEHWRKLNKKEIQAIKNFEN